jgi:putative SOS response-associated peptidase YedK
MTTEPAKDLRWLHDRMPCVLIGWEEVEEWLGGKEGGWKEGKEGTARLLRGKEGMEWSVLLYC